MAMGGAELLASFQASALQEDYKVHLIILDSIVDQRPIQEFNLQSAGVQVQKEIFSTADFLKKVSG